MSDRWPLTGRGEELRVIDEALADDGQGGVVIAGLAGVGKTRLARAAAETAARTGWSVRRVAGTTTGRAVTLGAFARWAADVDGSPVTLARSVFAGLSAGTDGAPLLVLVDDAHLLDEISALIVHQLVLQNVAKVIATIRTGEPAPDAVTALWKDGELQRLELQPLSRNESGHLLETVLGAPVATECTERMFRLSRGNVLFLHHLVEHERQSGRLSLVDGTWRWPGTPSASPSLIDVVEMQIGAVPADVRDVVDYVAVAEPLGRALLSELVDPRSVEAAEQRGLITTDANDTVYVGHPLYGEIRLGQCGPLRLSRLRGQIATAMAAAGSTDPLRLGLLWLESDLAPEPAVLSSAANIAASRLDLALAERLAESATRTSATPATQLQLAFILNLRENGTAAEAILDALSPDDLGGAGFVDAVSLRAANLLWPLRNPEKFRATIADALATRGHERDDALLTLRGVEQAMAAQPEATLQTMSGVDYNRLDNAGRVIGYSAETIAYGDLGRIHDAAARARLGYRVLDESPLDSFHAAGLAEFHAYGMLAAGCIQDAVTISEAEHRRCADFPGHSQSMSIAALGMTALGRGDLAGALRHLTAALDSFGTYGEISGLQYRFRILHTVALARAGRVDDAVAALAATNRNRHPAYQYVESDYLVAAAWVSAVRGRTAEVRDLITRAAEFARDHGQLAREVWCLQTAIQFGDASGGERLEELAAMVAGPRAATSARYARALAEHDAVGLDAVSRDFEAMGDPLAAADAAAQATTMHRAAGRKGSALSASARAGLLAKNCGGAVSPALAVARLPLPFTRREHQIAQLLSDGLTNRDIAEAMALSVRTVEGHIYQASAKAGVSSRAELSALVRQFSELGQPSTSTTS